MTLSIGNIGLPHAAVLAPMSGVTDMPFRRAVRRAGGGLVVTEMVASAAILRQVKSEMRKLRTDTVSEVPLSVQLAGWDPQIMAEAARIAADLGATFIDINMGCPAKKVTGRLSGSALMRDEPLAGVRGDHARHDLEQRGFSRSVAADQRQTVAAPDGAGSAMPRSLKRFSISSDVAGPAMIFPDSVCPHVGLFSLR